MSLYPLLDTVFEPELLEELETRAEHRFIPAGTKLVSIGQTVRQMPILLSGSLKISRVDEDGKELLLYYVNPAESCAMTFTCCMQQLLKTVDQIAFQQLDERLIRYLKEKVKIGGSPLLNLSHEQIATDLATSRVVISRLLKKLENQKKLLLYRNQVRMLGDM